MAILAVIAVLLTVFLIGRYNKTHFTVEKWNASAWNDRQLLIRSFLRQHDLSRMTRSDIVALLGDEPDFYNDWPIPNRTPDNLVYDFGARIYYFGNIKKYDTSNITLVIEFDNIGRVTGYELKTYSQ